MAIIKCLFKKYWKLITWAIVIIYLSLFNTEKLGRVRHIKIPHLDKIAHFMMYFILAILLYASLSRDSAKKNVKKPAISFGISLLYGGLMELLQYLLTSYRTADKYDMLFNTIGAILGVAGYEFYRRLKSRQTY
ncbi:MAG: VanZ family protein [Bacteroidales bacterium]|nr:VanZ family protein [Bacteroidales bacterium]